jgi:hypothetical protein
LCEGATIPTIPDPTYPPTTNPPTSGLPPTDLIPSAPIVEVGADGEEIVIQQGSITQEQYDYMTNNEWVPAGDGAGLLPLSLPSLDQASASNYYNGIPNLVAVIEPGEKYFYNNRYFEGRNYPSIYIKKYNGIPVPVVDPTTGEMVACVVQPTGFANDEPNPHLFLTGDDAPIGIRSDDTRYDIRLLTFWIQNTGFSYTNPRISVIDRDTGRPNGEVEVTLLDGRIVDLEILNPGEGFRRLPEIQITDDTGWGAKIRPILHPFARTEEADLNVPPIEVIYCPAKNQKNLVQ